MRKGILSAALLLATSGFAVSMHAQSTTTTSPSTPQATAPGTTTRTESTTTTTTSPKADATATQSSTAAGVNTSGQVQSFMGKVTKHDNQYMLEDKEHSANYKLDDAKKADKYEGKNVKVMGNVDTSTNMIHVQSIEEEKGKDKDKS
jgi:hypothetical protein